MVLALILTNAFWLVLLFVGVIWYEDRITKLAAAFEKLLSLTTEANKKHIEDMYRKFQTEINAANIRLEERDKQWQEYTATLTGKKVEA